jgi:hypothetical protein
VRGRLRGLPCFCLGAGSEDPLSDAARYDRIAPIVAVVLGRSAWLLPAESEPVEAGAYRRIFDGGG